VIFNIAIYITLSCTKNQRFTFRPTDPRASTLDLCGVTGTSADSDLSEALLVETFNVTNECAQVADNFGKSRVVTRTYHEDGG
jgi:hypothetical protein